MPQNHPYAHPAPSMMSTVDNDSASAADSAIWTPEMVWCVHKSVHFGPEFEKSNTEE
jgi:hypothetical protein